MTSSRLLVGGGVCIILIGFMLIFAGLGMDSTKTTVTCYNTDSAYGGNSCVETTYYDPSGVIFAFILGASAIAGGGYLVSMGRGVSKSIRNEYNDNTTENYSSSLQSQINKRRNE